MEPILSKTDEQSNIEFNLVSHIRKLQYIYVGLVVFLFVSSARLYFSDSDSAKLSNEITSLRLLFARMTPGWIDGELRNVGQVYRSNLKNISFDSIKPNLGVGNNPEGLIFLSPEIKNLLFLTYGKDEVNDLLTFMFPSLFYSNRGYLPVYDEDLKTPKDNAEVLFEKLTLDDIRNLWNELNLIKKIQIIGEPKFIALEENDKENRRIAATTNRFTEQDLNGQQIIIAKTAKDETRITAQKFIESSLENGTETPDQQWWVKALYPNNFFVKNYASNFIVYITPHISKPMEEEEKKPPFLFLGTDRFEEPIDLIERMGVLSNVNINSGSFHDVFPSLDKELASVLSGLQMTQIEAMGKLFGDNSLNSESVETLGFKIEGKMVFVFLSVFIIVVQIYLLAHLINLNSVVTIPSAHTKVWLVSFDGDLPLFITYGALVFSPILVYSFSIFALHVRYPTENVLIWILIISFFVNCVTCVNVYSQLRKLRIKAQTKTKSMELLLNLKKKINLYIKK